MGETHAAGFGTAVCHQCASETICELYGQYEDVGQEAREARAEARAQQESAAAEADRQREEGDMALRSRTGSTTRAMSRSSSSAGSTGGGAAAVTPDVDHGVDRAGRRWVAVYAEMSGAERASYLDEERYRVCASGPRGSPVLAKATKKQVTQADPCPKRPAHGSVVEVGGRDMVLAYSTRGRVATGGQGDGVVYWLRETRAQGSEEAQRYALVQGHYVALDDGGAADEDDGSEEEGRPLRQPAGAQQPQPAAAPAHSPFAHPGRLEGTQFINASNEAPPPPPGPPPRMQGEGEKKRKRCRGRVWDKDKTDTRGTDP